MAIETHTIIVTADTTIDDILAGADMSPLQIEHKGVVYVVQRAVAADDIWGNYDPQAVVDMLEDLKHNPIDIKIQQWIDDVYRSREEGSRPEDRP